MNIRQMNFGFNEYSAKIMCILKLRHMAWKIMLLQPVYT